MNLENYMRRGVAFVSALLCAFTMVSCGSKKVEKTGNRIFPVKVEEVTLTSAIHEKHFSSVLKEKEEVNLPFRVAGPIQRIYVKEGDYVRKGQAIAQMDPRDYKIQKSVAEAQYTQVKGESERVTELHNRKSVSSNDYDKMVAGEKMAKAQLKRTADQLNDTKLIAPFSGYVTKVNFEEGEMVNLGVPIVSLMDVSIYEVEIDVPASLYINRERFVSFTASQKNINVKAVPATLYSHKNKANNHGMYRLYLHIDPKAAPELASGMNVDIAIHYQESENDMTNIPLAAVFNHDNHSCVWVVDSSNHIHRRLVETSSNISNGRVQILDGLKASEKIVVGGLNLLSEGDEVKQVNKKSKTNVGNIM